MLIWDMQKWHSVDEVRAGSAIVEAFLVQDVCEYGDRTVAQCLQSTTSNVFLHEKPCCKGFMTCSQCCIQ